MSKIFVIRCSACGKMWNRVYGAFKHEKSPCPMAIDEFFSENSVNAINQLYESKTSK